MMTMLTRFFCLLPLLVFFGILVSPHLQAQDNAPYQTITPENLDQLVPLFSFHCDESRYGPRGAAFSGEVFVYECNNGDPLFTIYSLREDKSLWQYKSEPWPRMLTLLEGGDLILADFQRNLSLIRRTEETEIAHVDFIILAPVAISPDLKRVALVQGELESRLNTVVIYSLPDFTPLEVTFPLAGQPQEAILALTDVEQGLIAIGESDGTVRVLEVETGEVVMETPLLDTGLPYSRYIDATFTPDATQLLVSICTFDQMGCWEVGILHFDAASGELVKAAVLPEFGSSVDFLAFSGETSLLLVTACNGVQFFDVETFTAIDSNIVTDGPCESMNAAFNDDGTLLGIYHSPSETYVIYGIPRVQL